MKVAEQGPGLQAELLHEPVPSVAVRLERSRLLAGLVERHHQLPHQLLAQWILGRDGL